MQWILQFEENSKNKCFENYYTDYEICSEVRITGVLEYSDNSLLCGLLSEKNQQGLYSYTIRIKGVQKEYQYDKDSFSKDGYFFKGGVIGELIAIFSFFFQARFFLKSTKYFEVTPTNLPYKNKKLFQYIKPTIACNYEMFTDQNRNWAHENGLRKLLDDIKIIDEQNHQNLIHSIHWYHEAIKDIGINNELFFLKMVSCVESIANIEIQNDNLKEKFTKILDKNIFTNSEKQEIKSWLKNRKIKMKFIKFLEIYSCKGFFQSGYRKAKHCYIKKAELGNFLSRIYDARSDYVHTGKPMYISLDMNMNSDATDGRCHLWDQDPSLGMSADRKNISGREKLPRARWFERIVNYSIKKFIEEKTVL